MPLATLPNGVVLETPKILEAMLLYREIFEEDVYFRHGITLRPGDTVLDVGANVGMFSASLVERCRDLRILLFEPIPDTFVMLQRNAERLLAGADITLVNAAVSSSPGRLRFEIEPRTSTTATSERWVRSEYEREVGFETRVRAFVDEAERLRLLRPRVLRAMRSALDRRVLRPLLLGGLRCAFGVLAVYSRIRTKHVDCEATTLSDILRGYAIEAVDLVKLDVEGAEWAVLEGIEHQDWPRLHQLVVEVHGVERRAQRMKAFLESKGYDVTVAGPGPAAQVQHYVYATRRPHPMNS